MRVLLMGCERIGIMLAEHLAREGHRVTVLDPNGSRFAALPEDVEIEAVVGSGTSEEDLRRAGIEQTEVFVALTDSDNSNALAAQMARHIFQVGKVLCLIQDPVRHELYRDLGVEAVCPTLVVFDMLRRSLRT